jgi:hypothetical protein
MPWWAGLVEAIAWPLSAFLIVVSVAVLLIYTRLGGLVGLFARRVRKFKIPGIEFEIEIDAQAAKELRGFFTENFDDLIRKAKDQFDSKARAQLVRLKMQEVIRTTLPQLLGRHIGEHEVRATVHVPDIVFAQYLYQLIDYYPPSSTGGRAGRRFSQRFGIIGRAWRLGESIGCGTALRDDAAGRRKLIAEYGMFDEEANARSHARPSYLCVMLKRANAARGILFIDWEHADHFGNDADADALAKALERQPAVVTLSDSVGIILEELSEAGPHLAIEQ